MYLALLTPLSIQILSFVQCLILLIVTFRPIVLAAEYKMAGALDPKKIKFEDFLHVEGVVALDPKLPAFKTDGVRSKNLKLIQAYLVSLKRCAPN